jgi:hypothetical protein
MGCLIHTPISADDVASDMADDRRGRDKQARDADRRQQERAILEELERADETEPPIDETALDEIEPALDTLSFPATGADIVAAVGDRVLEANGRTDTIAELVPEGKDVQYDSPAAVRMRLQRPTVAAAMNRIQTASREYSTETLDRSKRTAYEKTLRALATIDADDEDEGIEVVTDWIVDRIREDETCPSSRTVRKRAATFCRQNEYPVRTDEWLGA